MKFSRNSPKPKTPSTQIEGISLEQVNEFKYLKETNQKIKLAERSFRSINYLN